MSVTDAIGRIAQIQATLVQLDGIGTGTSTSTTGAASSASSATSFADALAGALGTSGVDGTGAGGGAVTGADVVADAKKYLGVPYVFGGTSASGLDCSGLVQRVFKDLGIDVPRLVSGQSTVGTEVPSLAQAQPGDLIVTNGGEHIVIYAGDGKVIHAPSEGRDVSLVDNWMDDSDIVTIRRVVPQAATASTGASPIGSSQLSALLASALGSTGTGSASTGTESMIASMLSSAGLTGGGVSSGGLSGALSSALSGTSASSAQADALRSLFTSMMSGSSL